MAAISRSLDTVTDAAGAQVLQMQMFTVTTCLPCPVRLGWPRHSKILRLFDFRTLSVKLFGHHSVIATASTVALTATVHFTRKVSREEQGLWLGDSGH